MLMTIQNKKGLDMKFHGTTSTNRAIKLCVAVLAFALGVCVCLAARPAVAWADEGAVLSIEERQQLLADVRSGAIDMEQANEQFMQAVYASEEPGETYEATVVPSESAANSAVNALSAEDGQDDGQNVNEDGQIVLGPDDVTVTLEPVTGDYVYASVSRFGIHGSVILNETREEIPGSNTIFDSFHWKEPVAGENDGIYVYEDDRDIYFLQAGTFTIPAYFEPAEETGYAPIDVEVTVTVEPAPFVVEGGEPLVDYSYLQMFGLIIESDTPMTISMNPDGYGVVDGVSTLAGIELDNGANVTLDNVSINQDFYNGSFIMDALNILGSDGHDITVTLKGENSIISHSGPAVGTSEYCTLIIDGDGSLTARSTDTHFADVEGYGGGAGIGGYGWGSDSDASDCRNLTIKGGTIHAIGSGDCAGIGGGEGGDAENVRIEGGYIEAVAGSENANPIGSGAGGNGVEGVQITGGCFAGFDYDLTGNTVYGVPVAAGGVLVLNSGVDFDTFFAYPVRVVVPVENSETNYKADLFCQAATGDYVFTGPAGEVLDKTTGQPVSGSMNWEDGGFYTEKTGEYEARVLFVPDDVNLPSTYFTVKINVAEPAFIVEGGERNIDYKLTESSLIVRTDTPITVSMNENGYGVVDGVSTATYIDVVMVEGEGDPTITLRDVRIHGGGQGFAPLDVSNQDESAVTTIVLEGENELVNTNPDMAALDNSASYPIVIRGTGSLVAESAGDQPAIGGKPYDDEFTPTHPVIRIEGGTVTAKANGGGAGIGSAAGVQAPTIEIVGGNIDASSAGGGSPIGAGAGGNGVEGVTIAGGYFADASAPAAELAEANEVYGVTPTAPAKVWANEDAATSEAYPVYVAETEKAPEQSGEQGGAGDPAVPGGAGNLASPGDSQSPGGASGSLAATGDATAPLAAASAALLACAAAAIAIARKRLN